MKTSWRGAGGTLAIVAVTAALAACESAAGAASGAASGGVGGRTAPSTAPSSDVTPGGPMMGGPTQVTVAQNGTTVHVAVGTTVALVDFPSNWFPRSSDPGVLADPPVTPGRALCKEKAEAANPPGVPCTQIPLDYVAKRAGTAVLTAHRAQCGEARPCVAPEMNDFDLTVVVG